MEFDIININSEWVLSGTREEILKLEEILKHLSDKPVNWLTITTLDHLTDYSNADELLREIK